MTAAEASDADQLAQLVASLVIGQLGGPADDCWWGTQQVIEYCGRGRTVVAADQNEDRLHSHRRGERGRPFTKRSVVDAWMQGATPEQQATVCGCARFSRWAS